MGDPDSIADVKRQDAHLRPMPGKEHSQLYRDLMGAPQAVRDRGRFVLEGRAADALEMSGGTKSPPQGAH
jgi:hypothetical protein